MLEIRNYSIRFGEVFNSIEDDLLENFSYCGKEADGTEFDLVALINGVLNQLGKIIDCVLDSVLIVDSRVAGDSDRENILISLLVGERTTIVSVFVGGIRSHGKDNRIVVAREVKDRLCMRVTETAGDTKVECAIPSIPPIGNHRWVGRGCDRETTVPHKFVKGVSCRVGFDVLIPCSVFCVVITHN
ncbi:hypothetical protein TNCV_1175181 [Trichonephila clavipes]|nr:hypothetical protein TNCV_1175181 [Trichonephila clavipes]